MRVSLGFKRAIVVGLLGLVGAGISAFALRQASQEQARAALTESFWDAGLQSRGLAQAMEHAVVEASAVYTASDTEEAKQRLSALQTRRSVRWRQRAGRSCPRCKGICRGRSCAGSTSRCRRAPP